jgi:Transposase, Mutator family
VFYLLTSFRHCLLPNDSAQRSIYALPPAIEAIYRAETADMALPRLEELEAAWGKRYPAIGQMWHNLHTQKDRSNGNI